MSYLILGDVCIFVLCYGEISESVDMFTEYFCVHSPGLCSRRDVLRIAAHDSQRRHRTGHVLIFMIDFSFADVRLVRW